MEILNARHLKPLETQRVQTTVLPSKGSNHVSRPNRPLPTCLSSPDVYDIKSNQGDHEMSNKASDNLINEVTSSKYRNCIFDHQELSYLIYVLTI